MASPGLVQAPGALGSVNPRFLRFVALSAEMTRRSHGRVVHALTWTSRPGHTKFPSSFSCPDWAQVGAGVQSTKCTKARNRTRESAVAVNKTSRATGAECGNWNGGSVWVDDALALASRLA